MNKNDIDMCVADTLRDDEIEKLDSILHALNHEESSSWRVARGTWFSVEEVRAALSRLIDAGLVTPCAEQPPTNEVISLPREKMGSLPWSDLWFHLEGTGRDAVDRWWEAEGRINYPLTR